MIIACSVKCRYETETTHIFPPTDEMYLHLYKRHDKD